MILIVLRQILEDFDSNPTESQASDKYVTATEIKEEAELFLPATFNRAKFEKDLDRYIDSIAGFGFLVEAKHIEGEAIGLAKGESKEKLANAKRMLAKGCYSLEVIAELTNLSLADVEKLKEEA